MSITPQKRIWPVRVAAAAVAALAIGGGFTIAAGPGPDDTAAPRVFESADALAQRAEQHVAGAPLRIVASADALAQRAERASTRATRVFGSADSLAHRAEQRTGQVPDYGSADALAARSD